MKLWIQKILCGAAVFLMSGILLLSGSIIGMQNERTKLIQQEQAEVVTNIAIVNLDEGIDEDGTKKYYSISLMDMEAEHLVSENLEAARQGILNGSYAAYILIPAEFSQNAASINGVPQKAVLEFAINPNLREDVSRLTMSNVKNFEISLNTNMSYMYVQALLEEFHDAQDLSGTILQNDTAEMERLQTIDSSLLLVTPEYEEIEKTDPEFEEIEFEETFDKNMEIQESVYKNYEEFITEGEEEFAKIKEKEKTVTGEVEAFFEIVAELDISVDEDGNSVCEEGLEELSTYLTDYDTQYEQQQKLVTNMITVLITGELPSEEETDSEEESEDTEDEDEGEAESGDEGNTEDDTEKDDAEDGEYDFGVDIKPISEIIKEGVKGTLSTANSLITANNTANSEAVSEMQIIVDELKELVSEQDDSENFEDSDNEEGSEEGEADVEEPESTEDKASAIDSSEILEKLDELEAELEQIEELSLINVEDVYSDDVALEPFEKLTEEVNKIPKVDTEEYGGIFEEQVLTPLNEEIESENQKVQEAGTAMLTPLEEYIMELSEFDLYSYYDYDANDALMEDFGNNIFGLEEQIVDVHGEYEEYVSDTVDLTNETLAAMQEDLETAYEDTVENVDNEVSLAQKYRQSMNEFNTDILGSFQQKLPYTRIGQLEYVQAYDFMVKPIKMNDASITKDRTLIWQDDNTLWKILSGMVVALGICAGLLWIIRMRNFAEDKPDI